MNGDVTLAALQAARRGWRAYPLRPRSKRPYFARVAEIATTDPRTIVLWFGDTYRDAGLGAIPPAHVVRVDIDQRHDGNGWTTVRQWARSIGSLPPTLAARTPSGGFHLYYHTESIALTSTPVGPHVELKVGQTILPPTPGYRWCGYGDERLAVLPGWFADAARRSTASARTERAKVGDALATTLDELAWRIEGVTGHEPKRTRSGVLEFRCPAHEDRHPSAWAAETPRGIRVGCLAGCSPADVAACLEVTR